MALHLFTLIRYDMLAANLRQFRGDLEETVRAASDRERCRQLLANVEFVIAQAVPRSSTLYNWIFRWIWLGLVAIFPIAVLLVVQVRGLRYQSEAVISAERAAVVSDLILLIWFFRRRWLVEARRPLSRTVRLRSWLASLGAPAVIVAINFAWLNIPKLKLEITSGPEQTFFDREQTFFDLLACYPPHYRWGCRFLMVDHRTLVGHVWKEEAILDLRTGKGDAPPVFAAIDGLSLRNRTLRFVDFSESLLYKANLIEADLTGANLIGANLSHANLGDADLFDAKLGDADLRGADLMNAHLAGARLKAVRLAGARLKGADLSNADLSNADLRGYGSLRGADLTGAYLMNARLVGARLKGADLSNADLLGTDISREQLDSACGTKVKLPPGLELNRPCPQPGATK